MSLGHDRPLAMETFRRTVADAEAAFASLQQQRAGADERVSVVVETLVAHLKGDDALLVSVLDGRGGPWSAARTAVIIGILSVRIGMELDYTHSELTQLGHVALLYELATAPPRPGGEEGHRLIRALGRGYAAVADLVLQARDQVNGTAAAATARTHQDASIVALAATYGHLSRQLPSGPRAWPPVAVKEIVRRGRTRFPDPILKALIQVSVQLPVDSFVRLNSGEVARVVAKNAGQPLRPVVVVAGRRGKPAECERVDLRDKPFLFILEFLGHEAPDSETENRPT
jgi:hypothetical protein